MALISPSAFHPQDFTPSDEELELYDKVSAYLQDPSILAIKPTARHLVTLVVRKILASSTFAIADTLVTIIGRLESNQALTAKQIEDFETVDELSDELDSDGMERQGDAPDSDALQAELFCRAQEIDRLRGYRDLAKQIQSNRKGDALLLVLGRALAMAEKLGGQRKAVIFTESRRTQEYLRVLLEEHGYAGRTVLLNGSNDDVDSRQLYADWLERHAGSTLVSGSRTADMKAAVVEAFRDHRDVLITTEAGGEGINLQFCSLLVNYDLPWNPQRVEQRIGRIHRYGQKSDVVVVNFVNRKNRADQLVFELLERSSNCLTVYLVPATTYWVRSNPVWTSSSGSCASIRTVATPRRSSRSSLPCRLSWTRASAGARKVRGACCWSILTRMSYATCAHVAQACCTRSISMKVSFYT
ncbi:DEAD/DEAH box helicase [Xanthomonas hortorum pv. pelargonii]|nr:DEAD/DEAH box helicase [Xanthomonas hortorum pv. pelargonii]